jgi:hypothetical protein
MTKAELKEVRKVLEIPSECSACCACAGHVRTAMQLLDAELAELAKPEAREWRVAHDVWRCPRDGAHELVATDCGELRQSQEDAKRDEARLLHAETGNYRCLNIRTEFRTPAGPWERAE